MAIENDPSARMQLRTRGELMHPGTCMVCGSGTREEGYIDLAVFFDYEGHMYLCHTCVTQAAEILGMFTPAQIELTHKQLESALELNAKMKEELDRVRPIISAFERAFILTTASSSVPDSTVNTESEEVADAVSGEPEHVDSNNSESVNESDSGEPIAKEPVKSGGRTKPSGTTARNIKF